mmetsp:Transcript_26818/g.52458  ORF Transcript_26818/g.52458 Transcript_26818/m.52458 type:complete len:220 (+) Transcript_26818:1845-2504(+)
MSEFAPSTVASAEPPGFSTSCRRTQTSPSVHSKPPSGRNVPLNVSPCNNVETESDPHISSSDSSPQCQVIIASLMTHRGCLSSCPTQSPSKPSALQMMQFNRAMPALKAPFILGSAKTSSAFSLRSSIMELTSLVSKSFQSFEASSMASLAVAISRSCSFSRPRPWRDSRSRANVPACSLNKSAARSKKRSIKGSVIAAGHWRLSRFRKPRPHGKSTRK